MGEEERRTYLVEEAGAILGIGRSAAYAAVARGEIPHIRIGRRILIPRRALDRLLEAQPTANREQVGSGENLVPSGGLQ
jgi:excisionase family DNA binding protein